MAAAAILNLFESKIAPRTKHEVDRTTGCGDMAIRVCWGHMEPHFGERGGRKGSAMAPLERAMVVSYWLSIHCDRCAICNHSAAIAIECLRRSKQQGVGHFGPKFRDVPLGADPSCWGCKE